MENRSITKNIRNTGFALRDWLGPYYMLGGAVAFGIAMLTLLDPSGWLVRGVGAALLTVTLLAWARHFHLQRRQPAPPLAQPEMQGTEEDGPVSPHSVLLAITLFFLCGIVISEAFLAHQRSSSARAVLADRSAAAATTTASPAPTRATEASALAGDDEAAADVNQLQSLPDIVPRTAQLPLRDAAQPADPVVEAAQAASIPALPAALVQVMPEPSPAPATAPVQTRAVAAAAAPSTQVPAASRRRQAVQPQRTDAAPATTSTPAADTALTAQQRARCTELLSRFSLGETLQPSDRQYLGTTCH